jgi:hypothetical protein
MAAAHWRQLRIWQLEQSGEKNDTDLEMRLDRSTASSFAVSTVICASIIKHRQ